MSKSAKKRRRQAEKRRQEMSKLRGASSLLDDEASPMKPLESSPIPEKAMQMAKSYSQSVSVIDERDDNAENKASSTKNQQVSMNLNGTDGLSTQRKSIEFVLPKVNGKAERYSFDKQHRANLKQELSTIPEVDTPLSTVVKPKQKKEESIDEILFPNKRQKLADKFEAIHQDDIAKQTQKTSKTNESRRHSEVLPSGTQTNLLPVATLKQAKKRVRSKSLDQSGKDAIETDRSMLDGNTSNQRLPKASKESSTAAHSNKVSAISSASAEAIAARSKSELINRQLSGRSVEQAVRDKQGLRPRANSTDGELNLPQRGLCDEQMVLRSHQWLEQNFGRHNSNPRGFVNLGNTCFLNSILQCLAYSPPFCQSLITIAEMKIKETQNGTKPKQNQGQHITAILSSLFQKLHGLNSSTSNQGSIAPQSIVKALPNLGSIGSRNGYKFWPGRQEDAHEFLVHLLDAMHDGELRAAGINQHSSGWRDRLPASRLDETTFIHRIFGGYFRSQVRCRACGYCSNTYDPFLDLSLEVSKNSSNSILNALSEFTRKEILDANNQWKCSGCKKYVCPTKQLTVFRPPLSLCIQLKRFAFTGKFGGRSSFGGGGWKHAKSFGSPGRSKITKPIEFPSDLDLPLSDGRSCAYSLTGVVIHVGGSASSGHYTACVKKPGKKGNFQWYYADDSSVQPVSETSVLKQKDAYILFYCRKEVKLEFPSPPPRDMSTEEAREFGRARARARADSNAAQEEAKTALATMAAADQVKRTRVAIHPLAELLNTTMSEQLKGTLSPDRTVPPNVASPYETASNTGPENRMSTNDVSHKKQALLGASTKQSIGNRKVPGKESSMLLNSSNSEASESSNESGDSDSEGEETNSKEAQASPTIPGNDSKALAADSRSKKTVELTHIQKGQLGDNVKKLSPHGTPTPKLTTPSSDSKRIESSAESTSSDSDSHREFKVKASGSKTATARGEKAQIESTSERDSTSDVESHSDIEMKISPKQTSHSEAESPRQVKAQNGFLAKNVPPDRKSPQNKSSAESDSSDSDSNNVFETKASGSKTVTPRTPREEKVQVESSSESDSSSESESSSDMEMKPKQTPKSVQKDARPDWESPLAVETSRKAGTPDIASQRKSPAESSSKHINSVESLQKRKSPHQTPPSKSTTPKEENANKGSGKLHILSSLSTTESPEADSESSDNSSPRTFKTRESLNRTSLSRVAPPKAETKRSHEKESDSESEDGIQMSKLANQNQTPRSTAKSPPREMLQSQSSSDSESSDSDSDSEVEKRTPSHGASLSEAHRVAGRETVTKNSPTKSDILDKTGATAKLDSRLYDSLQKKKPQESKVNTPRNDGKIETKDQEKVPDTTQAAHSKSNQTESKIENQIRGKTRVVVGNEDSRGKVKVMLGPRKRNAWEPKTASVTQKGEAFQLLGNLGVSKWDDDEQEEPKTGKKESEMVPLKTERALIVQKMEKQESSRKRKMHLDRWDALLDQGKTKKVKSSQETQYAEKNDQPKKNVFQRIQSGIQKMNKGKAKGLFRRKSGEGSTMSNGRRIFRY